MADWVQPDIQQNIYHKPMKEPEFPYLAASNCDCTEPILHDMIMMILVHRNINP